MPSSRPSRGLVAGLALLSALAPGAADAAQPLAGFALERMWPSAPGGGWQVMDALELSGGPGAAVALGVGYARSPLVLGTDGQRLAVVADQATLGVGIAATYDRFRLHLQLDMPLYGRGQAGEAFGYSTPGLALDLGTNPDTVSDVRVGLDVRLWGRVGGPFRLGAGAQLLLPNGRRPDYDTDGSFRGALRLLFAGDNAHFTYAGHLGVHLRPLDDPAPGSPRGSELLFGVAAGGRYALDAGQRYQLVVGPELFGASALRTLFDRAATAAEALLSLRIEGNAERSPGPGRRDEGLRFRVRLGGGLGLVQSFGAPEWRLVLGVELFVGARGR